MVVHAQQSFDRAVRLHNVVLETFSAQMHVRKQAEQGGGVRQRALHFHPKVIRARWNNEGVIVELQSDDALLRRRLGEYESDACPVVSCSAIRRVVNLE